MRNDKKETKEEEQLEDAFEESAVEDEVIKLREQLETSENTYRRALADYQNLQKRTLEDRQEWIRSANKDLLLRILTVFDTLVMAYQHSQDKNLQVSIQQFLDILKSEGAIKVETVSMQFDPMTMEAIATEEGKEGEVLSEMRAGFMLNEKLLRAAQVTVGKGK